eukprot:s5_g76.t1
MLERGVAGPVSLASWSTHKLRRVCRSSLAAEAQAVSECEAELFITRILWQELLGQEVDLAHPATTAALTTAALVTDAKALYDMLQQKDIPQMNSKEKHTALEVLGLSQHLLEQGTILRWCNSDQQLSDGMTKIGAQDTIARFLNNGQKWNLVFDEKFTAAKKLKAAKTAVVNFSTNADPSWLDVLSRTSGHVKDSAFSIISCHSLTRMSLKGRSASGVLEDGKKSKGTLGVLSGGLKSTGRTVLKTGTTIGLLLGVVPSKTSRDYLVRKLTRFFPSRSEVGQIRPGEPESSGTDTDDSEADRIKEERRKRYAQKASKSWNSMDNAGENVKVRAREAVGYPETPEDWTLSLRFQKVTGILWFRMLIAVRKIAVQDNPPHPSLKKMVESLRFESAIGALIVVNAIISGIDAMYKEDDDRPSYITVAENIFVVIFVGEYFLRLRADTWVWMFEPMNMFDTFVVWVTGVLVVWILEPLGYPIDFLRRLAALRVLRLGRLARAVRIMPMFHELWMLVSGVLECTRLLFWSFVIIGVVHFMSAVVVMETITKSPLFEEDEVVQRMFGSLSYSMFTLFQFMTFDSWAVVARPIIYAMPEAAIIFLLFMGIASIVLFNLMTAIVVKNAFDASEADEEAKAQQQVAAQAKIAQDLRAMFIALDEDGSGTLTREEFTDVLDDVLFIRQMKVLDIDLEELPDIFDILDDGDGAITTEEFCLGLTRLQGVAMSRDMLRCTSRNKQLNTRFDEVRNCLGNKVDRALANVELSLEEAHVNLVEMQQMTAEVLKKLEEEGLHQAVRSTTTTLEEIPPPTLDDIAKLEEEQQRQRDLARFGRGQASTRSIKTPAVAKETLDDGDGWGRRNYEPIPATWVLTRRKKLEERKQAMRAQQWEEIAPDVSETVELPGVLKEMQATWQTHELPVVQKTREERMLELSTKAPPWHSERSERGENFASEAASSVGPAKNEGGGSASSTADGERRKTRGGEERCQQNEHQRVEGNRREFGLGARGSQKGAAAATGGGQDGGGRTDESRQSADLHPLIAVWPAWPKTAGCLPIFFDTAQGCSFIDDLELVEDYSRGSRSAKIFCVKDVAGCRCRDACLYLSKNDWDVEAALQSFYEAPTKVVEAVKPAAWSSGGAKLRRKEVDCPICVDSYTAGNKAIMTKCCFQVLCAKCHARLTDSTGRLSCPFCRGADGLERLDVEESPPRLSRYRRFVEALTPDIDLQRLQRCRNGLQQLAPTCLLCVAVVACNLCAVT